MITSAQSVLFKDTTAATSLLNSIFETLGVTTGLRAATREKAQTLNKAIANSRDLQFAEAESKLASSNLLRPAT